MTYNEFKIKYPDKEFGIVNIQRNYKYGDWHKRQVEDKGWELFLNHSCDEWVIGNIEEGHQMIKDLQQAIEYCILNP